MKRSITERRRFLKQAVALGAWYPFNRAASLPAAQSAPQKKNRVVCVGAHPDDPESGCGGTLLNYIRNGHEVSIVYLTRGEAGIKGKSHAEAAHIRTREAEEACATMGARPYFFGQTDGDTRFDRQALKSMRDLLATLQPDLLFAHWPIDTHPDHQVASLLAYHSWLESGRTFPLYYYEVDSGAQTMHFMPTDYVDITEVEEQKRKALYAHASQDPDDIYLHHHAVMQQFRGREIGVRHAEAFVRLDAFRQPLVNI